MSERKNAVSGKTMHIIPYTHADYAWTHTRQWHIERGALIINEVLELMEQYPDLTYCIDNANHLLEPFLRAYPEKKEIFAKRVREGRIEITGGIISLIRPTQAGGEIFVRNIQLGRRRFEKLFGSVPVNVYMNVDVSIGHRQIPQLMELSGIKYYRGWRPQGAMDYNKIPRAFWFEGIDGTRVLTSRGSYVGFCGVSYLNGAGKDYEATADMFYRKELKDILNKNGTENVWISHGMDDTRLLRDFDDTNVDIYSFVKKWNENESGVLKFSTPSEYFKTLEKEKLPIVTQSPDSCDVAYNAPCKGENGMWLKRQMLERMLCTTESLCAMAASFGFVYPQERLDEMWEGLAFLAAHGIEFLLKEDFDKCVYLAQKIRAEATELISASKSYIASRINVNKKAIVLFNTDTKMRKEKVSLDISFPTGAKLFEILDLQGNRCPYQIEYTLQGDISYCGSTIDCVRVLADVEVPAMGYTCLYVQETAPKDEEVTFNLSEDAVNWGLKGASCEVVNNGIYTITFSRGEIIRIEQDNSVLFDKKDSGVSLCELSFVAVKEQETNGWLFFNNIVKVDEFKTESWEFEEFGPKRWVLCCKGKIGTVSAVRKTTVYQGGKSIEFEAQFVISQPAHGYYKAAFPTGDNPKFVGAIPFGTEEKGIEQITYGKVTQNPTDNIERMWEGAFFSKDFVNYTGRNNLRQSVLANTVGGYYIYDKYDHTVSNILSRNMNINATVNWERFTDNMMSGKHNFKMSFLPSADAVETVREHKNIYSPIQTAVKFTHSGTETLADEYSLCEIKTENVILSAFKRCGKKYILRAYEVSGKNTDFVAEFGRAVLSAKKVDFFGNTVGNVSVNRNTITAPLGHNGIMNLEIELG